MSEIYIHWCINDTFFSSDRSVRSVLIYLRNAILALWQVENVSKLIHMCNFGSVIMMLWSPYFSADWICFEIKSWWTKIGNFSLLICDNNEIFHIFCLHRDFLEWLVLVSLTVIDAEGSRSWITVDILLCFTARFTAFSKSVVPNSIVTDVI